MDRKIEQSEYDQYNQYVSGLRLIDDLLFQACFDNNPKAAQLIVDTVMDRKGIVVQSVNVQMDITNMGHKSPRLDLLAKAKDGSLINIEVQCRCEKDLPKRARYYLSLLTSGMLQPGEVYGKLEDAYVIFLVESDIFDMGLPVYRFQMIDEQKKTPLELNDGGHIIFMNCSYNQDDDYGRLAHDMLSRKCEDINNPTLKRLVVEAKKGKKGDAEMSELAEKVFAIYERQKIAIGREQGLKEGIEQGHVEAKNEIAEALLRKGSMSPEEISDVTGVPLESVMEMRRRLSA